MTDKLLNIALLCGRKGSESLKNKNHTSVLGRPLMVYPLLAAQAATQIDEIYLSTDSEEMKQIGRNHGIGIIDRPAELATATSQHVDTLIHSLELLRDLGKKVNYLIVVMCNVGIFREGIIDECIGRLDEDLAADSCVTGHIDNDLHPYRVKRMGIDGSLQTWLPLDDIEVSTNRQDLPPCYVLDHSIWVLRVANCFPPRGQKPWKFMGNRILFVDNPGCRDVHSQEDIDYTEQFLNQAGWMPSL